MPSWPLSLEPQHQIAPESLTAQVCEVPADALAQSVAVPIRTGVDCGLVELLPTWPLVLLPQHHSWPPALTAQPWPAPTATSDQVVDEPTFAGLMTSTAESF